MSVGLTGTFDQIFFEGVDCCETATVGMPTVLSTKCAFDSGLPILWWKCIGSTAIIRRNRNLKEHR